ncbi:hypothetical protein O1611_g4749 [Lasiodiplodia mahajangana]|uniref:Uncharacterized protein n=1 Tax=Lasiodiplodia mahajangana TaxID=1108764 RepID=A0ACC2JN18_9PEZI|nr:hypothetical protein O1611_g4749 [Lasiodiplodia mahajangana]
MSTSSSNSSSSSSSSSRASPTIRGVPSCPDHEFLYDFESFIDPVTLGIDTDTLDIPPLTPDDLPDFPSTVSRISSSSKPSTTGTMAVFNTSNDIACKPFPTWTDMIEGMNPEQRINDWVQNIKDPSKERCYPTNLSKQMNYQKWMAIRQQVLDGQRVRLERELFRADLPKYPLSYVTGFIKRTEAQLMREARKKETAQETRRRLLLPTFERSLTIAEIRIRQENQTRGRARRVRRARIQEKHPQYAGEFWQFVEKDGHRALSRLARRLRKQALELPRRLIKRTITTAKIRLFSPVFMVKYQR